MAEWRTANTQGIAAVANTAKVVTEYTGVATTLATGMSTTIASVGGIVPSLADATVAGLQTAITVGTDLLASVFDLGCYFCLAYPKDLDFNYANLMTEYIDGVKQIQQDYGLSKEEVLRVFGMRNEGGGGPSDGEIYARLISELPVFPRSPFRNAAAAERSNIEDAFDGLAASLNEKKRKLYYSRWPRRTVYSFADWVNHIEESMEDEGDPRRPQFTLGSITAGVAVVVGAHDVNEFVTRIQRLAALVGNKKMQRFASAGANAMGLKPVTAPASRKGYNKFPDWSSTSLGDVVGLKNLRQDLQRGVSSVLGLSSKSMATAVANYISRVTSTVSEINSGINDVAALVNAAVSADIGASVLFIEPQDGNDTVSIAGQQFSVPKCTYGNEGFIYALRNSINQPTWNYVAGFVIMVGAPVPGFEALLQAVGVTKGTAPSAAVARYLSKTGLDVPVSSFVSALRGAQQVHSTTLSAFRKFIT